MQPVDTPEEIEDYRELALNELERQITSGYLADELAAAQRKLSDAQAAPYQHDAAVRMESERINRCLAQIAVVQEKIDRIRFGQFSSRAEIRAIWD